MLRIIWFSSTIRVTENLKEVRYRPITVTVFEKLSLNV